MTIRKLREVFRIMFIVQHMYFPLKLTNLFVTSIIYSLLLIIRKTSIRKNEIKVMEPRSNEKYTILRRNEKGLI